MTFLFTFLFMFTFGCICGICFTKKRHRQVKAPGHITAIYEDVLPIGAQQQEQSLALKQNVAYVASSKP